MSDNVTQNVADTCMKLGDVELAGIKLEKAEASLLDVSQGSFDQHVAMQPAAIAYYGSLKKHAARRLAVLETIYQRWEKKKYAEAKVSVESGTANKHTIKVEDIKARLIVDNEKEIEKWEERIEKAKFEYDTLDVWYEAWKQKSFSIGEFAPMENDERFGRAGSLSVAKVVARTSPLSESKQNKIREIMRKRKMEQEGMTRQVR